MKKKLYKNLDKTDEETIKHLTNELMEVIINSWGKFDEDFIKKYIVMEAKFLLTFEINGKIIAFCSVKIKNICARDVYYIEFLAVKKEFQKEGISKKIVSIISKTLYIDNLFHNKSFTLEVVFITPNIRVLASLAKTVSFVYPNPYATNTNGKINKADEITWNTAKNIISKSWNPQRKLHREGCVLEESYKDTPWLVYNKDNIPWHRDKEINQFAEIYLEYTKQSGKEFVVRAKINFINFIINFFKTCIKQPS